MPALDATGNYPYDGSPSCPSYFRNPISWTGVRLLSIVPVKNPGSRGFRYNYDATNHSEPPYCGHATVGGTVKVAKCETRPGCQVPPDFYMSSPHWTNEICDRNTFNPFQCHDVPQVREAGWREVCVVPPGERPTHPGKRCTRVEAVK